EVVYYLLFAGSFYVRNYMAGWSVVAFAAVLMSVMNFDGGPLVRYALFMLSLSAPWLVGHWLVVFKARAPVVPLSLGLALFMIGFAYARLKFGPDYYDPLRLFLFSLCCAPLLLSIIQGAQAGLRNYYAMRLLCGAPAIALLWVLSDSDASTKVILSAL